MKKIIGITIALILLLTITASAIELKDIANHWGKGGIEYLIEKGSIDGYPNGTFKPDNTITRAEFIKILVVSLGSDPGVAKTGFWADTYINESINLGLVHQGEISQYNSPILRGEIARMVGRTLDGQSTTYPEKMEYYGSQLLDLYNTPGEYKEYILKCYVSGIIAGFPDGDFKYQNNATRAEAVAMIVRLLETDQRIVPEKKIMPLRFEVHDNHEFQTRRRLGYEEGYDNAWFGIAFVPDRAMLQAYEEGWEWQRLFLNPTDLNLRDVYSHTSGNWYRSDMTEDRWFTVDINGDDGFNEKRTWFPLQELEFNDYGTLWYRKNFKFINGDIVTVKLACRRKLEDGSFEVHEQIFNITLFDRR